MPGLWPASDRKAWGNISFQSCVFSLLVDSHLLFSASPVPILNLPDSGTDPEAIDYEKLPRLPGKQIELFSVSLDDVAALVKHD